MKEHLREKRQELIWAVSAQGYNDVEVGQMFGVHKATIGRIIRKRPKDYKPKWVKVRD